MPETSPHTDASDAPEKRDIYGLYDMSDTADAADMYEAPEAFDVFDTFDPGILPDAAEAVSTDSRMRQMLMKRPKFSAASIR